MTKDEALTLALEALKIWEQMYPKSSASAYRAPAITAIKEALAQPEQEPWATREDFYLELDRRVERIRKEMEIKTVTMRCKDYDIALQIIDMHFGHVFVGQVSTTPKRPWVGLTEDEISSCDPSEEIWGLFEIARKLEARLKELNT